ncbi:hypothetical protein TWF694_011692 [Orbilia ellipsospora]|uniref:Nodulin-like domain-containing protein n=1 Tax=Orbilia ellipsospora TaxID=2528407 RepID=A0AAV9X8L5_9PEZI
MPFSPPSGLKAARYIALAACTAVALACGTNYVYSAYAPQLARELHLSTSESNVIGTAGNFGMYLSGIPAGMLVDRKGPRLAILIGAFALFAGYFPIYKVFDSGTNIGVGWLAMFSAFTGVGSCFAFNASIKVAALNFPKSRGTATALPLAAFGLSAFFFSTLSSWLFPGNTSDFLLVLSTATASIVFGAFFFIRIIPSAGQYSAVPTDEPERSTNRLRRTKSRDSHTSFDVEPGMEASNIHFQVPADNETEEEGFGSGSVSPLPPPPNPTLTFTAATPTPSPSVPTTPGAATPVAATMPAAIDDERTSFLSTSSDSSSYGTKDDAVRRQSIDAPPIDSRRASVDDSRSALQIDIRGWALTQHTEFWRLFLMLGILTGIGLMTINNIGHSVQALWYAFDPNKDAKDVERFQGIHVSILSLCSFSGRLISGTISDVLKKKWALSRVWLVFTSSSFFLLGQIAGMSVSNPLNLWLVSGINGCKSNFIPY